MGNFFSSSSGSRLKVNVKDLRTGKNMVFNIQRPFEYTVDQLLGQIVSRLSDKVDRTQITLKYKKEDIIDSSPTERTLGQVLKLDAHSENNLESVNLFLERVERRGGLSRDWVIYVKTLTGRMYDIHFANPQEVSIMGLKLLIEEECGVKPEQMRLVLNNEQLEESTKLIQNVPGMANECTVHLVMKSN